MSDGLNRAQRTAVTTLRGPLLVLAGAGTGKTRVITFRIAELIKSGISPGRILAVTFTNKAAKEMRERAQALLGRRKKNQTGPEISTFHSLCVRVLRRHATRLGYPAEFTIYDRGDQESVARSALRDIRVGVQKLRPGDLIHMISGWKSTSIRPQEAERMAKKDVELLGAMAYGKYQAALRAAGAMDFDDLLLLTEQLFMEHPEARFAEASRFDHLLIDEYQDTNGLQYRIVKHLANSHRNLCVVGDDDQSIYGWRGAEVQHILNFKEDWPEARVVRLEENYRSTEWVLKLANTLIAHNKMRHDKVLSATRGRGETPRFLKFEEEEKEAEAIVREIHGKINREDDERVPASKIAILFRTNEQPRVFELELRRAGVPYVLVGGQSFYDRKEIKDLLCYLRVLANPNDEVSLLRIINTPSRGIGTASIQALLDQAVERGQPLWKLLPEASKHAGVSSGSADAIENFRMLVDEFRARVSREKLSDLFRELVARINYKAELERQYKDESDQEARWNAVEEFVNSIAVYEGRSESPSLLGYLEETALTTRDEKDDDDRREHSITLMTLHSAKGLEFPHVYLVGMEEGTLPHKRSVADGGQHIDEERRLAYVGVTRAQDTLTLSFCKNRMKWGKLRPQLPSRFLLEMRGETEKAAEIAAAAEEQIGREVREAREREEEEAEGGKKKKRGKGKKGEEDAKSERRTARDSARESNDAPRPPPRPAKKMPEKASAPPSSSAPRAPESEGAPAAASDLVVPSWTSVHPATPPVASSAGGAVASPGGVPLGNAPSASSGAARAETTTSGGVVREHRAAPRAAVPPQKTGGSKRSSSPASAASSTTSASARSGPAKKSALPSSSPTTSPAAAVSAVSGARPVVTPPTSGAQSPAPPSAPAARPEPPSPPPVAKQLSLFGD